MSTRQVIIKIRNSKGKLRATQYYYCSADFSTGAPDYIKDEVNTVIDSNSENVLKIFEKIYHSRNVNRTINKIKKKYIK